MGSIAIAFVCFAIVGCILAIFMPMASKNTKEAEVKKLNRWDELSIHLNELNVSRSVVYAYPEPISTARVRFVVDEENHTVYVSNDDLDFVRLPFSEIIGYETIIDDRVTDAVGRSVIGGVLAGEAGAIIGAMTAKKETLSYKLVIYRNNIQSPQLVITLIENRSEGRNLQEAENFASKAQATLKAIIHRNQSSGG